MWITAFLFGLFCFLVAKWIQDRRSAFATFRSIGIDGPNPDFLFGNRAELRENGFHASLKNWKNKYGKTFGYFEATRPVLVTSDLNLLKYIMIQQFSKFHGRKRFRIDGGSDKFEDMFAARGEKWKKLRTISSQLFLTKRLREMSPIMHSVIDRVMLKLDEKDKLGAPFDIYDVFQRMTLEVIGNVAFGIQTDSLSNPDDTFLQKCRYIFGIASNPPKALIMIGTIGGLFPAFFSLIRLLIYSSIIQNPSKWFLDTAKRMIVDRQNNPSSRVDFISIMLKARATGSTKMSDLAADDDSTLDNEDQNKNVPQQGEMLTIEEMQAQSMLFLLAGYETTSTALGFLFYELALHPDVQEKMVAEIDEHFSDADMVVDNHTVQKLNYTDMAIKECLRLHTIANIATTRCCMVDCVIEGVHIPYGLDIQINSEDIHMDAEHWGPEDPHAFVPERFTKERVRERHPLAWMPFGQGPRNCVGMRLAYMEIKLLLVRFFRVYTVGACSLTPEKLPTAKSGVQAPSEGVFVKIYNRSHD